MTNPNSYMHTYMHTHKHNLWNSLIVTNECHSENGLDITKILLHTHSTSYTVTHCIILIPTLHSKSDIVLSLILKKAQESHEILFHRFRSFYVVNDSFSCLKLPKHSL